MLSKKEVTLRVGGAAGDGIASTGESFAKMCARSGLNVFAYNSYQSVIRGGFIWLQVHAGKKEMYSHGNDLDFLIALNQKELEKGDNDEENFDRNININCFEFGCKCSGNDKTIKIC